MSQSLAQKRAQCALKQINEIIGKDYDKYVSYVSALPATIIMSGLGQAMAMLKSGKKPGHEILYGHMRDWICRDWKNSPKNCNGDLVLAITKGSEDDYIRAQVEALEYLEWLKKFAVAYLDKEGS